jgi:sulfate transport system permease protein
MSRWQTRRGILPGFSLTLGITLGYLGLIVLLPLGAMLSTAAGMGPAAFWAAATGSRALATYGVTLLSAAEATLFNGAIGLLFAWVLARYDFPGRRVLDALIDLPFAMPTAVAGLSLATLFSATGWFGQILVPLGIQVTHAQLGIAAAMAFTSLPFVVRSVQPVIEDMEGDAEEAARSLGASEVQTFFRVVFPTLLPSLMTGLSLAFARCLGEFGAIIFIAGNRPYETEITALLIFIRLEEYEFGAATAIATTVLLASFVLMLLTNVIQARQQRYLGAE